MSNNTNIIEYIITGVIVLGLLIVGALLLFRPGTEGGIGGGLSGTESEVLSRASAFVEYRRSLEQVQIDTTFFNEPRFQALRTTSVSISQQPTGKSTLFDTAITNNESF